MAGRHPFEQHRERMSPEARSAAEARRLDAEINLAEVRRAVQLSQDEIGQRLQIAPGSVAEVEERADLYVSAFRRIIEAMGGELGAFAKFAGHSVTIDTFADLHAAE